MVILKVIKKGKAVGVTIPMEMLKQLNLKVGDSVLATLSANGLHLSPLDSELDAALKAFAHTRLKYHDAFRELAR